MVPASAGLRKPADAPGTEHVELAVPAGWCEQVDAVAALVGLSWLTPEEIAKAILFLASDESSYMNAGELVIDRGYTA
jgi:NAD(P)-dependent dehydrogenase (short-subunit alcohol dehydrogenase family)